MSYIEIIVTLFYDLVRPSFSTCLISRTKATKMNEPTLYIAASSLQLVLFIAVTPNKSKSIKQHHADRLGDIKLRQVPQTMTLTLSWCNLQKIQPFIQCSTLPCPLLYTDLCKAPTLVPPLIGLGWAGLENIPYHPTALITPQWVLGDRCSESQAPFVTVRLHCRFNMK